MTQPESPSAKTSAFFRFFSPFRAYATTSSLAIVYGYLCVWLFDGRAVHVIPLETFSWSFVMLVPYAIGIISVSTNFFTRRLRKDADENPRELSFVEAIFIPWLGILGVAVVALILSFGFLLCFIISVPILFPAASFGGLSVWLVQKHRKLAIMLFVFALFAPFGLSPVEARIEKERETVQTLTSIQIDADAAGVWAEIGTVDPITAQEHRFDWIYLIGLPRPISATLSDHGVGGVRRASYENGLHFDEEIIDW
ncbi:MAG: hypothetical protein ACI85U_004118 [Candidatus Promineifilaceae bacterium]|jgi:hypothetical protein